MDPDEVEFFGEKSFVTIVPTFNHEILTFVSGDIGPFRASVPIIVPLWIAVNLKKQQLCTIQPPDWMDVDYLEDIKQREIQSNTFIKMPSEHYMVEAKLLLGCAADDFIRAEDIRTLIKDIWDIRMSKLRSSTNEVIKDSTMYAAVDNLTMMEINTIRPILPHALDQIYRIQASEKQTRNPSQHSTNQTSRPSSDTVNSSSILS